MCREIPRVHTFNTGVQGNTQITHLLDRCSGKLREYTSLRQMCKETPRVHVVKVDVQGSTQQIASFRLMCRKIFSIHIFKIDVHVNTQQTHH